MVLPVGRTRPSPALLVLIVAQIACAVFFAGDAAVDLYEHKRLTLHLGAEILAAVTCAGAVLFEMRYVRALLRRQARLTHSASLAQQAIADVIEAHFSAWKLTPAEHDVANLLVKGLPITEIARIRGSAEGTVKSQLNAIYRKSGSQNRGELLSQIIDSLMDRAPAGS